MQGLFLWIVMFAGAAIALMGLFLVSSERELKNKRRQIEELLTRLESSPESAPSTESMGDQENAAELMQLRATNQNLQQQIAALSSKLELSRRSIEELESAAENSSSHAQARQPENAQQNLLDLQDVESKYREERQSLETHIAELNRELSAAREQNEELNALRLRLAESQRQQQSLEDEIRRHDEEIPKWQARVAEAEAHRQQLASLQAPYSQLLSKQASLIDKQQELQADFAAFASQIANPLPQAIDRSRTSFDESVMNEATEHSARDAGAHDEAASEPQNKTGGLAWFQR